MEIVAINKSIELRSGQASILITDRGDIQIKGTNITIDAQQAITVNGLTIERSRPRPSRRRGQRPMLDLKGGATASLQASGVTEIKGSLVKIQ